MKNKIYSNLPGLIFSVLVISFLVGFYVFAWTEPTTPPPGGNVPAPLNVGNVEQIKLGPLRIDGVFRANSAAYLAVGGGNVGIGTTSPTEILSLGNAAARKIWIENTASGTVGRALTVAAGGTVAGGTNIVGGNLILQSGLGTGTGASTISFQTGTTLGSGTTLQTMATKMTILGNGNVGIGTTSPGSRMVVQGAGATSATSALNVVNSAATSILFARNDGNVGIGTTSPSQRLDVAGNIRTSGLQLTTGAAAGRVLTSDASGNATWQTLSSMPTGTSGQTLRHDGSNWVANSVIFNNGTNVGIGTTNPETTRLYVSGTGKFTGALDMTNQRITSLATPVNASDAVNKAYVDALGSGFVCPNMETSNRATAYFHIAVQTCRDAGRRLPTREEMICFVGTSTATVDYLWTQTYGSSASHYSAVKLDNGMWMDISAGTLQQRPYRCVW